MDIFMVYDDALGKMKAEQLIKQTNNRFIVVLFQTS